MAYNNGESVFTSSGVFTVPENIRKLNVFIVGGGGPGRAGQSGGGGGGYTATEKLNVQPLDEIIVSIGSGGGATYTSSGFNYTNGSSTSVGGISVSGGYAGSSERGGNGGSGGGGGGYAKAGGSGGSDGGNGGDSQKAITTLTNITGWTDTFGGTGQGTTTRAFGESDGTLYAGGGGGYGTFGKAPGGAGGGGGGGWETTYTGTRDTWASDKGTPNTGGGGGGGITYAIGGGSGIAIIRW